nr:hypothetical protein [Tanacetum cinerariifolium]
SSVEQNFLSHPFTIDLMPVELGSFNAIIGMDCLRRHHAVIVSDEKLVRVPFGNETLVFCGAESYIGRESRLTVKDIPIVQDFPEVFPENLPEFQIDLIPRVAPVVRAPYRLAPSDMKELSEQLQELSDKVKNLYPLPRINDLFDQLQGSSIYLKIDLRSRYHQLRVRETRKSMKNILRKFLGLLKEEKLYPKFSKCEFWILKVQFLGQVIDSRDSQMHNNFMAAGSRDRPPMLAPGRYPQWRSRFLRYVDTRPNGEALRKCILSGPYKPTTVLVHAVESTDNSPAVAEHTTVEIPANMSPENKAHFLAEKEAIHLILTGIGDDIYSTVHACQTAQEMWEAIERLQQGESLNIQEVNVQFLQQLQPEWSRFVTIVKQQHKLDEVSYHKLFDILKQYQNEVNELRAKKIARNANPLALVATAQASQDQYYQTSRSHRSSAPSPKPSIPSRSHTSTRHKG